jgi:cytochrome c553
MKPIFKRRVPAFAAALLQALALTLVMTSAQAQTDDATLGRQKAQTCAVCHGPLGVSVTPDAPNLAGQPALYTAAQLRAYRSGARKHEVMAVISKPLSDDDIRQLAAWFSSLRVDVQLPP